MHRQSFKHKANNFVLNGAVVELTEKRLRTSNQNRYLHLILGYFALEIGEQMETVKEEIFKKLVNPILFIEEKDVQFVGKVKVVRSSSDLSKEEMTTAIDRFVTWSAQNGITLPSPNDLEFLQQIEIELSRQKQWL